jgi:tetratricopeptide (TPR) repeat protein
LALMIWPLLRGPSWRRRLGLAAAVLALAVVGVSALYRFSPSAHERIQPFLEGRFESSRPIIWQAGWRIWRDHLWLGSGAASYDVLFDQYRKPGFLNDPHWTHNDYLNTLSDYGVVGGALWLAAGAGLLWLGWREVRRARAKEATDPATDGPAMCRLGWFVGLLAFAFHLAVDFHTKVPALAFAAAIVTALLLRDDPALWRPLPSGTRVLAGVAAIAISLVLAWRLARPHYAAEQLRYVARRVVDRNATTGQGDRREILARAQTSFGAAVNLDPTNAQAWSDLSYSTMQGWREERGDLVALGRRAEGEAERALVLCPARAEFWVRKGVALDMQARQTEGEICFRRALGLAPHSAPEWYYYAYHLSVLPGQKPAAQRAVETCLSLDPSFSAAVTLRQQLAGPAR